LNKRPNFFLIIRFRALPRMGIIFPLLLPVLEETIEELADLISCFKWAGRSGSGWAAALSGLMQLSLETIREIRALGPCQLVQVETAQVRVSADLK